MGLRPAVPVLVLALLAPLEARGVESGSAFPARVVPDRIEIRLAPAAAAAARLGPAADPVSGRRLARSRTGVAALDRIAGQHPGLAYERLFRGESAPPRGSDRTDFTAFHVVRLPASLGVEAALAAFRSLPEVLSADPIPILRAAAVPNDSLWPVSTWFDQPSDRDLDAPAAWDLTTGDTTLVVGIIDSGVLAWHPDLEPQLWRNPAEAAGAPGVDDDGNGYVDDVRGWDFVALGSGGLVAAGEDWQDEDPDPSDFAGHGTKVAGIVGAATDNGIGVAGTAWRVRLMPLRVMWSETGAPLGVVRMDYVAEALLYATRMGASVVNCSFETQITAALAAAAAEAARAGVVIVCPAGNSSPNVWLASRENAIAVGSVNSADVLAASSNTGPFVDLAAPGVQVHSTFVRQTGADSIGRRTPGYDGAVSGTSFAAPFAAGAAVLVQARRRAEGLPPLDPYEMVFRLRETADDIAAQNPGTTGYGSGRLNLHRALTETSTSTAFRTGARTVGPAVAMPALSGAVRTAFVTFNSRLVIVAGGDGDTLANVPLPGRPARQLAAGSLGAGRGLGLFAGTINGKVTGHDPLGQVLPGWPVDGPDPLVAMIAGPALGDLDGDGEIEVVCGADDGSLWAWHAGGALVAGFPVTPGAGGWSGAVALADLDGVPGVEIVARSGGDLHVIRGDGAPLAGWPQAVGTAAPAVSPVVARLGPGAGPAILVPVANGLRALGPDGSVRATAALAANLAFDPALGDLDGDGTDEIVAGLTNATVVCLDSALAMRPGWPAPFGGAVQGPPVIGPLRAGGANGVLAYRAGTLLAWDDSARALPAFPKPGGGGQQPTLAEVDGDGRTEVVAGTGPDSTFFVYDAGAATWSPSGSRWPTPRGDAARTGSRFGAALPLLDDLAPAAVADLAADSVGRRLVRLRFTAPGDDGAAGRAARYEVEVAVQAATFVRTLAPADSAGAVERREIGGLQPGTLHAFRVRAFDESGNSGAWSAPLQVTTLADTAPPPAPAALAIRPRATPSRIPVELVWSGPAGAAPRRIRLYDLGGRMVRTLAAGADSAGVARWDGRADGGHRLGAGLYFARLESGGARAETRIVLVP